MRKCANLKCLTLLEEAERVNKKYCSNSCKNKVNNNIDKSASSWEEVLNAYNELPFEPFIPFPKWLKENYLPPKTKKITL